MGQRIPAPPGHPGYLQGSVKGSAALLCLNSQSCFLTQKVVGTLLSPLKSMFLGDIGMGLNKSNTVKSRFSFLPQQNNAAIPRRSFLYFNFCFSYLQEAQRPFQNTIAHCLKPLYLCNVHLSDVDGRDGLRLDKYMFKTRLWHLQRPVSISNSVLRPCAPRSYPGTLPLPTLEELALPFL